MLFNSPTQFAVLALLLAIGWLFGFASRSGGRKWRDAYRAEANGRAQDRAASDTRIAELERELEQRRAATSAAQPAFAAEPPPPPVKRGWFDWGQRDDLTRLSGINASLARRLHGERVDTYRELATLSDQDELGLERRLDLPAGTIQRDQWREQAQLLATGDDAGHTQRFG